MRKRLLLTLLALCMVLTLLPSGTVLAAEISSGTCGDSLMWTLGADGTLTISGKGEMTAYEKREDVPWYKYRTDIKRVIVENGVSIIGNHAFTNCSNLTCVIIPASVTGVAPYYDGNTWTYNGLFSGYELLTSAGPIGGNYSIQFGWRDTIPEYAFVSSNYLASVTIPDGVSSIGFSVFSCCSRLTNVTIPDSVTSIGTFAFEHCISLTSVTLGNSVTSIGNLAFQYCENLINITIPGSVTRIIFGAFDKCRSLTDVYYSGTKEQWQQISIEGNNESLTSATIHYNCTGLDNLDAYNGFLPNRDGWCIINNAAAFGYADDYKIPASRYYEIFGINLSSLLKSVGSLMKWKGNCFGMSLLSIANYNGQIDLSSYFPETGDCLGEYGFSHIETNMNGKQYFSVSRNAEILQSIERAQISQKSSEFKKAEVFMGDNLYSDLLAYLNGNNPRPLLVGLGGKHSVVISTANKPVEVDNSPGWYSVELYDPNDPRTGYSALNNPEWWYEQEAAYLLLNTNNGDWQYWRNGSCKMRNSYSTLWLQNIQFYDVSLLGTEYFTKPFKLWEDWKGLIPIYFSSSDFSLKDNGGNMIFQVEDNIIVEMKEGCEYYPIYGASEDISSGVIAISDNAFQYDGNDSGLTIFKDDDIIAFQHENTINASIDMDTASISFETGESVPVALVVQRGIESDRYEAFAVEMELDNSTFQVNANNMSNIQINASEHDAKANISVEIFCKNPQNLVKQRITPHFLTADHPNYYEFTTKE